MDEPQLDLARRRRPGRRAARRGGAPRATALFCDIDGTVSPIVSDPYRAVVPEPFRAALAALAPRLGLLAFVTGRDVRQAAAMVGLEGAAYVGLHGFDRMAPDGTVTRDPAAQPYVEAVQRMARRVRGLDAARLGLVVENKGPMLDLHYRQAADPAGHPGRARGRGAAAGARPWSRGGDGPLPGRAATARGGRQGHRGDGPSARRRRRWRRRRRDRRQRCEGAAPSRRPSSWATTSPTAPASPPSTEWARADSGDRRHSRRRAALAVAALTDETPRQVKDGADVWVAATPGDLRRARTALLEATRS